MQHDRYSQGRMYKHVCEIRLYLASMVFRRFSLSEHVSFITKVSMMKTGNLTKKPWKIVLVPSAGRPSKCRHSFTGVLNSSCFSNLKFKLALDFCLRLSKKAYPYFKILAFFGGAMAGLDTVIHGYISHDGSEKFSHWWTWTKAKKVFGGRNGIAVFKLKGIVLSAFKRLISSSRLEIRKRRQYIKLNENRQLFLWAVSLPSPHIHTHPTPNHPRGGRLLA